MPPDQATRLAADVLRLRHYDRRFGQVTQQLHETEELKHQFLRTVNHELRTPLTAISSYLELLQDGDLDPATGHEFLSMIERNSDRIRELIDGLLLLASLTTRTVTFEPGPVDVAALVREVVIESLGKAWDASVMLTAHAKTEVSAWADARRLHQVLSQVLDNAGDTLHLSIFDAMGHDTAAGLTATIAMGACRNNRRQGADLLAVTEAIDAAIAEQFGGTRFATGILADLDIRTGALRWVNRGHHPPLVLRGGHVVASLEAEPDPPMSLGMGACTESSHYQLQPGDRLLFYTDGVIEAKSPDGHEFGLERFADFIIRREADGMPAPETLRRLIQTLLDHQHDHLDDDATVLRVEWQTQRHHRLLT
ncbi:SpoIIE family protein phosphatase [Planobispora rosea]|nr:SpoIIE family protein phosphatase [Planobispora rosea]